MDNKFVRSIHLLIGLCWSVIIGFVIVCLLFVNEFVDYFAKQAFFFSNAALLILGILTTLSLFWIFKISRRHLCSLSGKILSNGIYILASLFLIFQIFVFYNTYFQTGWDPNVVLNTAMQIVDDNLVPGTEAYFSHYPNNMLLLWIESVIFTITGTSSIERMLFVEVILLCMESAVVGILLFSIVRRQFGYAWAYTAWGIYAIHVALHPWNSIFYSDSVALLFPVLILWLYQNMQKESLWIPKWMLIGAISYLGFKLKPQVLIVLIALLGVNFVEIFNKFERRNVFHFLKQVSMIAVGALSILLLCTFILFPSLNMPLDKEKEFGISHFFMMGLNTARDGIYNDDDVEFSMSFDSAEERNAANWDVARERMKNMGPSGLAKHLVKKTLVNYGNGMYGWGVEGGFYTRIFEEKNSTASPFLRNIFYGDGRYHTQFCTVQHMIWLTLLFFSMGCAFYYFLKERHNKVLSVTLLSLIGITLFQLLFEARSRYLFLYSPFYIISAVTGFKGYVCLIQKNGMVRGVSK